jgi:site-specific recombinase XerD
MRKFEEIIKQFLQYNTSEGYEKDVQIFKNYINSIGIQSESVIPFLQGIRTKEVIDSLNYYIKENSITSIETAYRYISCIKEFLCYLLDKEIIVNTELTNEFGFPTHSNKSFKHIVNNYISKDNRLKERKGFVAFSEDEINLLIKDCDDTINEKSNIEKAKTSTAYFNKIRAALIIKLIIFCGVRYEHLHKLTYDSVDWVHNTITVNNFTLHLPHNLRDQFGKYNDIIKKINNEEKERKFLFINFDGSKLSEKTSSFSNRLKNYTGRMDVNGIIKYAIINMIYKGVNESLIKKLTGVNQTIYNPCQNEVNKNLAINANSYLDSKLRSIHTFDKL